MDTLPRAEPASLVRSAFGILAGAALALTAVPARAEEYRVRPGDTLSSIARENYDGPVWGRYGSVAILVRLNPQLKSPHWIFPGERIELGGPEEEALDETPPVLAEQEPEAERAPVSEPVAGKPAPAKAPPPSVQVEDEPAPVAAEAPKEEAPPAPVAAEKKSEDDDDGPPALIKPAEDSPPMPDLVEGTAPPAPVPAPRAEPAAPAPSPTPVATWEESAPPARAPPQPEAVPEELRKGAQAVAEPQDPSAEKLVELGEKELRAGHPEKALKHLRDARSKDPTLIAPYFLELEALKKLNRKEERRSLARAFLKDNPTFGGMPLFREILGKDELQRLPAQQPAAPEEAPRLDVSSVAD